MINSRKNENGKSQVDIAIIGAGGAGLAAAVAASEKGAKVIVLEKLRSPGGNSAKAESFFAAESPAQKRELVDAPRDVLFKMAMSYAHWKINPRIVRAFIDKSGDTVRWLEEKGLIIHRISPYYPNQVIRTEHQAKKGGPDVIRVLLKSCKNHRVPIWTKTAAKKILVNEQGRIKGILAINQDKKDITITTKSVIIATGGYAANKELLKKYCTWYSEDIVYKGLPLKGDGLMMAMDMGAATEGLGMLQMAGPIFEGARHRAGIISQEPNTIWVNSHGKRFVDESTGFNHFEAVNALIQQPGRISYTIFDERILQQFMVNGPIKARQGSLYNIKKKAIDELAKNIRLEMEKGTVKISDTWNDLAKWIGTFPKALKITIEEYNACCDKGYDDIFAKDHKYLEPLLTPPFYVMRCHPAIMTTIGGIKINHHMEVLNHDNVSISGLFAAGNDTGGWEPETYNVHLSGSTFGFALNSGRIAGENAAQYVLEGLW